MRERELDAPLVRTAPGGATSQAEEPSSIEAHRPWLLRLASAALRDQVQAEDCVQDVFLAALQSCETRWVDEGSQRAWLRRVLLNRIRKLCDRDALRRHHERRALVEHRGEHAREPFEERELALEVERCLQGLEEHYREVIRLRHGLDLYPMEIAGRLRVPIKTVNSRLYRAYGKLRRSLAVRLAEFGRWQSVPAEDDGVGGRS